MNNLESAEIARGSNLKLLAEHKMEGVYQTPCPRQTYLKDGYFLEGTGSRHLRNLQERCLTVEMWEPYRSLGIRGDHGLFLIFFVSIKTINSIHVRRPLFS